MNKEQTQQKLEITTLKIRELLAKQLELVQLLRTFPATMKEKLQNVLEHGSTYGDYVDGKSPFWQDYYRNIQKYQQIMMEDVVEAFAEEYICDSYEDQLEMMDILGYDYSDVSLVEYNRITGMKKISKEEFLIFIQDVIDSNQKQFKYDW